MNDLKYFHIRITYGKDENTTTERFTFYSDSENRDDEFDKAVKQINKLYKESGHFKTRNEVLNHFKSYGFDLTII